MQILCLACHFSPTGRSPSKFTRSRNRYTDSIPYSHCLWCTISVTHLTVTEEDPDMEGVTEIVADVDGVAAAVMETLSDMPVMAQCTLFPTTGMKKGE